MFHLTPAGTVDSATSGENVFEATAQSVAGAVERRL